MAPAKGKAGKKGGKLSKADKERLKAEEAERKAYEEEQARLAAEQAEVERIEKEKLEKEERRRLEDQERIRHQAEIDELASILEDNGKQLREISQQEYQQRQWLDYVECSGRPDPTSQKEINTFLSLWNDERIPSADDLLKECEDALLLDQSIRSVPNAGDGYCKTFPSDWNPCTEIYNSVFRKLNALSKMILQSPTSNLDPDTMNLNFQKSSHNIAVSIWGNTAKNPRAKSIDFSSPSFSMELPKALVLADVAFRMFHVSFDLFSPQCSTYHVRQQKKQCDSLQQIPENHIDENQEEQDQTEESLAVATSEESKLNESEIKEAADEENDTSTSKMTLEEAEAGDAAGEAEDADYLDDRVIDLRAFSVNGPVVYIELFALPPQPKQCNGWTMQQDLENDMKPCILTIIDPTAKDATGVDAQSSHERENSIMSEQTKTKSQLELDIKSTSEPIKIKLGLPADLAFFEAPCIARWDGCEQHWLQDGFQDMNYNEDEKTFEFKMCLFGPIAVFQDVYINMPFQSWELTPIAANHCVFNLFAAMVELEVEIKNSECCLRRVSDCDCLTDAIGKWMSVESFKGTCKAHGINVFPNVDGKKYVAITDKDSSLVQSVYQCIGLLSSSFAMRWSKWSSECAHDTVVVQACESLKGKSPSERDFNLCMTTTRISCELGMKENADAFTSDIKDGRQMHPNLYHLLLDGASSECRTRIEANSCLFTEAVYNLLQATDPIVFS